MLPPGRLTGSPGGAFVIPAAGPLSVCRRFGKKGEYWQ